MAKKLTLQSLYSQQNFLRLLIFSFVTVVIWIGGSIVMSQQRPQISLELQQLALPLNPRIDLEVIGRIEQKKAYSDEELNRFPFYLLKQDNTGADSVQLVGGDTGQGGSEVSTQPTPTPNTDAQNPGPVSPLTTQSGAPAQDALANSTNSGLILGP